MSNSFVKLQSNCTVPFKLLWKDSIMLWRAANLRKDFEQTLSANQIKCLCQVKKGSIESHPLLSTLLLELVQIEDHVNCWPFSMKTTLWLKAALCVESPFCEGENFFWKTSANLSTRSSCDILVIMSMLGFPVFLVWWNRSGRRLILQHTREWSVSQSALW